MKTTAEISNRIMAEYAVNGNDIRAAYDKIIGEGSYEKLALDVVSPLSAKLDRNEAPRTLDQ